MASLGKIQLGKNGVTAGFIETLKNHFEKHKNIKISVLKSCCRDKKELKEIEKKILDSLGKKFTARSIGYTINVKKWRKEVQ